MNTFLQAMTADRFLKPETRQAFTDGFGDPKATEAYGLGFMHLKVGDREFIGHTGHGDTFAYYTTVNGKTVAIAGTFNRESTQTDESVIGKRVTTLLQQIAPLIKTG